MPGAVQVEAMLVFCEDHQVKQIVSEGKMKKGVRVQKGDRRFQLFHTLLTTTEDTTSSVEVSIRELGALLGADPSGNRSFGTSGMRWNGFLHFV